MSDDEEIAYIKRQKVIHFGSLEEQERQKLADRDNQKEEDSDDKEGSDDDDNSTAKDSSISGNVNLADEYMELEEEKNQERQQILEEFERRKKARQINVSTDDSEVKATLRQIGEPISLFGEGPAERRERLRQVLARLGEDALKKKQQEEEKEVVKEKLTETTWYHEGTQNLSCDAAQTEGITLMDLSWTFDETTIYWVTQKKLDLTVTHNGTDPSGTYWYQADEISAGTHGGTHMDSPCHFAVGRWCVSDIPLERLVVPAVVVDISHEVVDDPDVHLTVNHLLKWERAHGPIPDGSLLFIRTGWSRYWPNPVKYSGTMERNASQLKFPSIFPDAGKWLAENRNIVGIGIDTMSIDIPTGMKETHRSLLSKNVYGLENVNLRKPLPPKGIKAYVMPMNLKGASGAPCRVVVEVSDSLVSGNIGSGSSFTTIWTVAFLVAVWVSG